MDGHQLISGVANNIALFYSDKSFVFIYSTVMKESLLKIKPYLDSLYEDFDVTKISPDPLEFVRKFNDVRDIEIVGLIASSLAYGRVDSILISIDKILTIMNYTPYQFVMSFDPKVDACKFMHFKHRFNSGDDICHLIYIIQKNINRHGSLEALFLKGYKDKDKNIRGSLETFVSNLLSTDAGNYFKENSNIGYLLPSPKKNSACKRLNLYLRWMVRSGDVDLGVWKSVSKAKLIIPLDTHIARISGYIGLTCRKNSDWKTAEEITESLKVLDVKDPVKYDFSLCRLGILNYCTKKFDVNKCIDCKLKSVCVFKKD